MNKYDYMDKALKRVREFMVRSFDSYTSKDNLSATKKLYSRIKEVVDKLFLKIVRHYYKKHGGKKPKQFDDEWLYDFLMEFDPIMGYRFNTEWERKLYRQYEIVEACNKAKQSASKPIQHCLSLLNQQVTQKSIESADVGTITAYKEAGIKKVRWKTQKDGKVCDECEERDGKVFDINKLPQKHWNCRCWLEAVRED